MSWLPCRDPIPGDRPSIEAIETIIIPRSVDLGGLEVRRVIPSRDGQMVGPFIFFDQMGPAEFLTDQGIDVRPHPHINLATVTYLFEGEILHRDNLGTEQHIKPGAVNWMNAGSGIVHSERTDEKRRKSAHRLSGLQTWVALPEGLEECDPAFKHLGADRLPLITDHGLEARILAGEAFGQKSPLQAASETLYVEVKIDAGKTIVIPDDYTERAIYTLDGTITVDGETHEPHQLLILRPGITADVSASEDAHFMVFGGAPMDGPRYIWWNFVSSRRERIEQAKEEWAKGRFETVPGDAEEFIPLPESSGKPRQIRTGSDS